MNQIRATVGLIAASKSGARVCVAFFGDGGSFWALIYWRVEPLGDLLLMSGHCDDSFVFSRTRASNCSRRSGASDRARGSFVSASVSSRVKLPASSLTVYNLAVLRLSDSGNRAEQCRASCPGCLVEPRNDFNFFLSLVVLPFFVCVSLTTQYAQFSLPVPEGPISTSWARPLTFPVW